MWHRHLSTADWTPAAIDDAIARGRLDDWKALRDAAAGREEVRTRVLRVCAAHVADPYAQRYHFWNRYVRTHAA
jgi:hypothetical protein